MGCMASKEQREEENGRDFSPHRLLPLPAIASLEEVIQDPSLLSPMESLEQVVQDPFLLSRIIDCLDDHFDILHLSLASKFHRQTVLSNLQRITCRCVDKLEEIPTLFPCLTSLDLSRVPKELDDSAFPILLPKLASLQIFKIKFHFSNVSEIERIALASLQNFSQLEVLSLEKCFVDDQIAERIGEGCKLLRDITLRGIKGPLSNNGLNGLLLSSTSGIRRLSFRFDRLLRDDPMLVIMKCSTVTYLDLSIAYGDLIPDSSFPTSIFKLNGIRELKLSGLNHALGDHSGEFIEAVIRAASPLEIVEVNVKIPENYLKKLCDCTTLQSLVYPNAISALQDTIIQELISKNHAIGSLHLEGQLTLTPKAMAERVLSIEGTKEKNDHNITNVLPFFSRISCTQLGFLFGFKEGFFSNRIKFLQEITLCFSYGLDERTYKGLYELLSICTLLRKVDVQSFDNYENSGFCRALDALIGCPNLEVLCAPVGNKTLRRILRGVKGLRELEVRNPREEFGDEALLLLKENSPFLQKLTFFPFWRDDDGSVTDTGLEDLSFCSQLQFLTIAGNIKGSTMIHLRDRCLRLGVLSLRTYAENLEELRRIVQKLGFENRGCCVYFDQFYIDHLR